MTLTPELLGSAAVGLLVILASIGGYLKNRKSPPIDHMRIGGANVNETHVERLLKSMERIAVSVEKISDDRQQKMQDTLDAVVTLLKDQSTP